MRLPGYLSLDDERLAGRVVGRPRREDVPFLVNETAVVELYARESG